MISPDILPAVEDECFLLTQSAAKLRDLDHPDDHPDDHPVRRRIQRAREARLARLHDVADAVTDVDRAFAEHDALASAQEQDDQAVELLARLEGTPPTHLDLGAINAASYAAQLRTSIDHAHESIAALRDSAERVVGRAAGERRQL